MQHLRAHLTPDAQPECRLYDDHDGVGRPMVTFRSMTAVASTELTISLAGHPDPAAYLRELALALVNLAALVEASTQEVPA